MRTAQPSGSYGRRWCYKKGLCLIMVNALAGKSARTHEDTEGVGGPLLHTISPSCHRMRQSATCPLATPVMRAC